MIFTWEDGFITDIHSEFMDYNEDASYYENLEAEPLKWWKAQTLQPALYIIPISRTGSDKGPHKILS